MKFILIFIDIKKSLEVKILVSADRINKILFTDNTKLTEEGIVMSKNNNRSLVPEARQGLENFKNEVAQELGVPFKEYNGDLSSRQCGSVGGEMVKRMVEEYEHRI